MSDFLIVTKPKFYGWAELRALGIQYTNPGIKDLEDKGRFPKRIHLSPQRIVWLADAVDTWVTERINNPDLMKPPRYPRKRNKGAVKNNSDNHHKPLEGSDDRTSCLAQ